LSRHDDVARPIENQNLPVSILEQSNGPDHALYDFYFLCLMLALPKEGAATWNERCAGLATLLNKVFTGQSVAEGRNAPSVDLRNKHLTNPSLTLRTAKGCMWKDLRKFSLTH
jgi:hypothetical protein